MTELQLKTYRTPGAVIYTRVSTGEQEKNGTSPETQRDACRAKALALGLPIVAEYHDGGISGGYLLSRPGMQAAIADIQAGRANTLICPNISRYSRDTEHQQTIKKAVKAAGGRLVFCDMDFDDTPEGDLAFGIMGGFAQYERALIKDRTMKGKRKRAKEGQQPQRSTPAYGYHIITNAQVECGLYPSQMRGQYVVIEEEAEIVRELFTRYAAGGTGLAPLAQSLNGRGIAASRGGLWHPTCIAIILRNPVYKGQPAYGRVSRTQGEAGPNDRNQLTGAPLLRPRAVEVPGHQPVMLTAPVLISDELWDKVQARLSDNRGRLVGSPQQVRMLTGRIECPCGHRGVVVGSPGRKAYQCSAEHQSRFLQGVSACRITTYSLMRTETCVVCSLQDSAERPDIITKAMQAYREPLTTPANAGTAAALRQERTTLDAALAQITADEIATIQGQIAGIRAGASPDAYASVFADLAARRKDTEDRRGVITRLLTAESSGTKAIKGTSQASAPALAQKALADLARVLTSPAVPGRQKRDLVGTVISRVVCQPEGADIYYLPGVFPAPSAFDNSMLTELMQ